MDWAIVAVPAATVLGAALALVGVWVGARQRERADQRAEWGRLFATALGELAEKTDPERIFTGRAILESLARNRIATAEDRALVEKLLARGSASPQGASRATGRCQVWTD